MIGAIIAWLVGPISLLAGIYFVVRAATVGKKVSREKRRKFWVLGIIFLAIPVAAVIIYSIVGAAILKATHYEF